ncbi:hypothetical protein PGTUg99_025111 [Puccinia graminis f. sp. tritici]|uniref:F-box domain-containing protein n=1 Tax=Puccinia graminis f. sp. tritici TaxID=56615 RepID=A0A5B0MFY5_PUCGR|nr:hypothetical protein PGTUg99_025111 [Puccinia graminis f. sp. tritici]
MAGILALSDDILDVVLKHLLTRADVLFIPPSVEPERGEWIQSIVSNMLAVAKLRLVCQKWANWLYERHLYRMLSFKSSAQSNAFINQVEQRRSKNANLPLPRCRYLKVSELWTWEKLPPLYRNMKTEFSNLDALLDKFSETIFTLDLEVINFFTLPTATIERISRIKNLRALKLGIKFTKGTKLRGASVDRVPNDLPLDSECLSSLLKAVPEVAFVDLTDFRPVCSPSILVESHLAEHQFSNITTLKLDVKVEGNLDQSGIVCLAAKLPNLKRLSIGGAGYDGQIIRPILEILREQLEELVITDARILEPIQTLSFPKLRLFRLHDWEKRSRDLLKNNMFSSDTLEVLSFHSSPFHKKREAFLDIPFDSLHLKRLEFHYTSQSPPPRNYEKRCQDHAVECLYIYHGDINMREEDNLNFDLPSAFKTGLKF